MKPHLGSASHCSRYCSNRVPAPDSLKAKGSSQIEGGKGKRSPREARRWHRHTAGRRSPSPLPPFYKSKASDTNRAEQLHFQVKHNSAFLKMDRPSWLRISLQSLTPARILQQSYKPLTTRFFYNRTNLSEIPCNTEHTVFPSNRHDKHW